MKEINGGPYDDHGDFEESPIMNLEDQDLDSWYRDWLDEQDDPASIDPEWGQ